MKMEFPMMGTGALFAANITQDKKTGIGAWTDEQIARAVKEQKHKDGSPIFGPMTILGLGWGHMADTDVKNVVAYLRTRKPVENTVPKSTFKPKGPPAGSGAPMPSAGHAARPVAQ
jgi:hypothetical protein